MIDVNWENITELSGELRSLKDNTTIAVDSLALYPGSKKALSNIHQKKPLTRDNQCWLIDELLISKAGREIIKAGQHSILQTGNTYVISTERRHHTRFSVHLEALVPLKVDSSVQYPCEVTLGNVEFDLSKCSEQILEDGSVLYKKVPMILYPAGTYSVKILE